MLKVLKATRFADRKHAGQVRKSSGADYASHPLAVSYLVAAFKRSRRLEDLLCACILHDVLEDTDTTFIELAQEFGPLVASLVQELTNDPEQIAAVGKAEYQRKKLLGISSYGLVIKLADRLHNIGDSPRHQTVLDTIELMRALRAGRRLSPTHELLVTEIEAVCAEHMFKHQEVVHE